MRWEGFRKVRSQVCKRVARRVRELGLDSLDAYRLHLSEHREEWRHLDGLCRVTISRFFRDRRVFEVVAGEVLPALAANARGRLRCWSCGCASGEEAYTVSIAWHLRVADRFPDLDLEVVATDIDAHVLERAGKGLYPEGCLRDLPQAWRDQAFVGIGEEWQVGEHFGRCVEWRQEDVRQAAPRGVFDLVMCRNLAFTYYALPVQAQVLRRLADAVRPGGALVVGKRECLPPGDTAFEPWIEGLGVYRRRAPPSTRRS
jgi:chemotaxis protein methyltransferase CheR